MKQFFTVFRFTYLDAVRKKAFLITTAVLLVLVLALCLIPRVVALFSGESDAAEESVSLQALYLMDEGKLIPGAGEALGMLGYDVKQIDAASEEDAKMQVKDGAASAMVTIRATDGQPEVIIGIKDFMHAPNTDAIHTALTAAWRMNLLLDAGAEEAVIEKAMAVLPVAQEALGSMDLTGYTLGIVVSMLMFFAVYFYGISVANSVAMEKTSRVMETLVISAKPSAILAGKCAAMGMAGLTQLAGILVYSLLCYKFLVPEGTTFFGMELSFAGVTPVNLLFMILYFLLGYALFAMMYAVCGATVSRIEDVSAALMPVSLISMGGFYVGYFTSVMGSGGGAVEFAARYVPFCAPFGMPFRLMNGSATVKEATISVLIMLVTIVLVTMFCVRMYKASVMHYGKRLKLTDLIKMKG